MTNGRRTSTVPAAGGGHAPAPVAAAPVGRRAGLRPRADAGAPERVLAVPFALEALGHRPRRRIPAGLSLMTVFRKGAPTGPRPSAVGGPLRHRERHDLVRRAQLSRSTRHGASTTGPRRRRRAPRPREPAAAPEHAALGGILTLSSCSNSSTSARTATRTSSTRRPSSRCCGRCTCSSTPASTRTASSRRQAAARAVARGAEREDLRLLAGEHPGPRG